MEDFFKGLSPEDARLVGEDLAYFGTAYVKEIDGKKVRIPPSHVALTGNTLTLPNGERA